MCLKSRAGTASCWFLKDSRSPWGRFHRTQSLAYTLSQISLPQVPRNVGMQGRREMVTVRTLWILPSSLRHNIVRVPPSLSFCLWLSQHLCLLMSLSSRISFSEHRILRPPDLPTSASWYFPQRIIPIWIFLTASLIIPTSLVPWRNHQLHDLSPIHTAVAVFRGT